MHEPSGHEPFDRSELRRGDRRRGRARGWDRGWDMGPGFGPGPRARGRRPGRRGDVRAAVLLLLAEEPRHGYQLIREITERSNQAWSPSPGSVYPVLAQLEDEGLITIESVDGRKTASLTPEGDSHVEENRESFGSPWDDAQQGDGTFLRENANAFKSCAVAWRQVIHVGTPAQQAQATTILDDARRKLYAILAEDAQE